MKPTHKQRKQKPAVARVRAVLDRFVPWTRSEQSRVFGATAVSARSRVVVVRLDDDRWSAVENYSITGCIGSTARVGYNGYNRLAVDALGCLRALGMIVQADEAAFRAWFDAQEILSERSSDERRMHALADKLGFRVVPARTGRTR